MTSVEWLSASTWRASFGNSIGPAASGGAPTPSRGGRRSSRSRAALQPVSPSRTASAKSRSASACASVRSGWPGIRACGSVLERFVRLTQSRPRSSSTRTTGTDLPLAGSTAGPGPILCCCGGKRSS